jgi:CDP-diacylglycerol--glycerol-3-phosphate 3-phosphatidyltransferase
LTIYGLKPQFQALLRPLTSALFRWGVTANQVTVAACVASIAIGVLLSVLPSHTELFLLIPIWFFLRMAFNAVDGMLAREFHQASALGAYLNELTDVISDAALYVPFALLPGASAGLMGSLIVLAVISEMAGVLGQTIGASRRYDGPMGKSDRAFVFGLIGLLIGSGVPVDGRLNWVWAAVVLLLALTILKRIRAGLAELRRQ